MRTCRGFLLLGLLLAAPTSCGSEEGPIGINNVTPGGSVGGIILNAVDMKPMEGVSVSVVAGAKLLPANPALTDTTGRFSIEGVPSGDIILQIVPKNTHLPINIEATLPNAAGEYPLGNATLSIGPVALLPVASSDGAFKVQLVAGDGSPAPSVKCMLRTALSWIDLASGSPTGKGVAEVEAASDNSGIVRFAGMPDLMKIAGLAGAGSNVSDVVRVVVPPYDSNKDGAYDFFGKEQAFNVSKVGSAIPTILLTSAAPGALQITASNIAALMGKTGNRVLPSTSGALFVAFNWPIDQARTEITIFDEQGKAVISAPTKTVSGALLTVNFTGLAAGSEYNIGIRTFATVEGTQVDGTFGAPVFTPVPSGAKVQVALKRETKPTSSRITVTFSEPIGLATPANPHLVGGNAVLYFDFDINGSGTKGDAPGERGASSSGYGLFMDEAQPPGPAGKSGLGKYWYLDLPNDNMGNPVPAGTAIDFMFSRSSQIVQRADGTSVADIVGVAVPN